ncbi:hypothetical protein [Nostoc sp.]
MLPNAIRQSGVESSSQSDDPSSCQLFQYRRRASDITVTGDCFIS